METYKNYPFVHHARALILLCQADARCIRFGHFGFSAVQCFSRYRIEILVKNGI